MSASARKLNAAIRAKDGRRVRQLLREGASADSSSCFLAIERKQYSILRALAEAGTDLEVLEPYWRRTPVVKAVKLQDKEALRVLLQAGASASKDCVGGPPLHCAAMKGWVEGARLLIEKGASLEQQDCSENTPLLLASRMGHFSMVKLLIEAGANPLAMDMVDRTAYDIAVEEKREDITQFLAPLSTGKKPRPKSAVEMLIDAIKKQDARAFRETLASGADANGQDKFGWRPLDRAVAAGSVEFVRRLIEAGADVNRPDAEGGSAMDYAIMQQQLEVIEVLLKAGARPHSEDPLYTASALGNLRMLKVFLKAGYDPAGAALQGENTPLMAAVLGRSPEVAQLLIKKGVPVDACSSDGWTALFYAVGVASVRNAEVSFPKGPKIMWAEQVQNAPESKIALRLVKLLLDNGADPNRRNREGRTPLTYACSPGSAQLLIQRGARLDVRDRGGREVSYWLRKNGVAVDRGAEVASGAGRSSGRGSGRRT
jgi:ankyrin repeat protein